MKKVSREGTEKMDKSGVMMNQRPFVGRHIYFPTQIVVKMNLDLIASYRCQGR